MGSDGKVEEERDDLLASNPRDTLGGGAPGKEELCPKEGVPPEGERDGGVGGGEGVGRLESELGGGRSHEGCVEAGGESERRGGDHALLADNFFWRS